jgi:hypothetical protein
MVMRYKGKAGLSDWADREGDFNNEFMAKHPIY